MPTTSAYFAHWLPRIEDEIQRVIDDAGRASAQPPAFNTMLNYHLGFAQADGTRARLSAASGKRIRPMLVLLAAEAACGDPEQALPVAAAVELLHNFSLIHDDIEDRDELRRGRPTLWKLWGQAQAINTGDAMFAMAHLALESSAERGLPAERILRALRAFDQMCVHLTIGQHLDLGFETRDDVTADEYMRMIEGKTAALTHACCELGAIVAGAPEPRIAAMAEFGRQLGLAFQLQDDVLGIWGDPAVTGKAGSDLKHRKKTLPVIYAAGCNPIVRALYFQPQVDAALRQEFTDAEVEHLRGLIEACGGRQFAEQAAQAAYDKAMLAFAAARIEGDAANALHDLAHSLLGRRA